VNSGKSLEELGEKVVASVELPLLKRAEQLRCIKIEDNLLFESDIIVDSASDSLFVRYWDVIRTFGHGDVRQKKLWPNAEVPYDQPPDQIQGIVKQAMAMWADNTPIKFTKFTGQKDFVSFKYYDYNASAVGRKGGQQVVRLRRDATEIDIAHELGHVIGLYHEQSRIDYDQFIVVHMDRIKEFFRDQFEPIKNNTALLGSYDFDSIMHYPETAFVKRDGDVSIERLDGSPLGPRTGISKGDIAACEMLYANLL